MISAATSLSAIIGRLLLSFVLFRAALHKTRDWPRFQAQLRAYRLLPQALLPLTAAVLAVAETLTAVALLNIDWRWPALMTVALLAVYALAMAINLKRGRAHIDCGCGGPLATSATLSWLLVTRNAFLASLALLCFFAADGRFLTPVDYFTLALGGAASLLLYAAIEQAIANLHQVQAWQKRETQPSWTP